MFHRLSNQAKRLRTYVYRIQQERSSEQILIGFIACTVCDVTIPVHTPGIDLREDESGEMEIYAPVDLSDVELHRMTHDAI